MKLCGWRANWATLPWCRLIPSGWTRGNMTGLSIAGETKSSGSFEGSRAIGESFVALTNWTCYSPASSSSPSSPRHYALVLTGPSPVYEEKIYLWRPAQVRRPAGTAGPTFAEGSSRRGRVELHAGRVRSPKTGKWAENRGLTAKRLERYAVGDDKQYSTSR